ncbi:hypothetical protein DV515_00016126 [Chloebia gouldiae]|uniref:Uncharacterized protein n=1 Tax=Chloebia gouldiae TaxID=44316 RepID=A0A3L8RUP6_CHLGU|nr:hypothetical protein DV515_00016126 [Chloebia gouldiae]
MGSAEPAYSWCTCSRRTQGQTQPSCHHVAKVRLPQDRVTPHRSVPSRPEQRLPHVAFIQTMTTAPLWAVGTGKGSPAEVKYPTSARTPALSPGCSPSCTPMATGPPRPPVSAASPA